MKEYHEELQYLPQDNEVMDNKRLWQRVQSEMKIKTTKLSYLTWIEPLRLDHIDNDSEIVCLSWSKQEKLIGHIKDHYGQQLEDAFRNILKKNYRVVIHHEEEPETNEPELSCKEKILYRNYCT